MGTTERRLLMLKFVRQTLLVVMLLAVSAASALSAPDDVKHPFYPYYPSLVKWNRTGAGFNSPDVCAECHPEKYEEWTGSMHYYAFKDPIYQGELNLAYKAGGHALTRQCEGCHSPFGMMTGETQGAGLKGLSPIALAGVSCDICHSISGHTHWQTPYHQPENGSMILSPGYDGKEGPVLTKYGPFAPEEGCGDIFHTCLQSELHQQAELCASCHQVNHYQTHTPLEATYQEWKNGPYAVRGIVCQDCHMVPLETLQRTADTMQKPAPKDYRHYFNGANFLLYYLIQQAAEKSGDAELAANAQHKYSMAVARLQAAAGLEIEPIYHNGRLAELKVRVKNLRAGHGLPTSLTNVRQIWLELTVKDLSGNLLLSTGTLNADGSMAANARQFNSEGMGEHFHFAINPWEVITFARHDTVPPKGYRDVYYGLTVPADIPKVTVEATLRYRQAGQNVAAKILQAVPKDIDLAKLYGLEQVPELPVVDMAQHKITISAAADK